jgi:hypothetical protein
MAIVQFDGTKGSTADACGGTANLTWLTPTGHLAMDHQRQVSAPSTDAEAALDGGTDLGEILSLFLEAAVMFEATKLARLVCAYRTEDCGSADRLAEMRGVAADILDGVGAMEQVVKSCEAAGSPHTEA